MSAAWICRWLALASWLLCAHTQAAIYSCPIEGGGTVFQDRPCEDLETQKPTAAAAQSYSAEDSQAQSRSRTGLPENMHESWFERPSLANDHVWCDRVGCECGGLERSFRSGITQAVADALYLDGSWHRYNSMVEELDKTIKHSFKYQELRLYIDVAACDIMMSQNILKRYGRRTLTELKRAADLALQMGQDDPTLCDAGDQEACKKHDAYELYELIKPDLESLKLPRYDE
ncbi:MAG: DUF4124 domain-containing protein [Gammaproteobacteria bacterium]|nr:DUF4124 domain-containing protein [Gammaproteobacteria bacterium]